MMGPSSLPPPPMYMDLFCLSRATCYCKCYLINKRKEAFPPWGPGRANIVPILQICGQGWFPPQAPILSNSAASKRSYHWFSHIFARDKNSSLGAVREGPDFHIPDDKPSSHPIRSWAPKTQTPWPKNILTGFQVIWVEIGGGHFHHKACLFSKSGHLISKCAQ